MQISQTQPQTLMLFPNVAQGAHQALLDKSPVEAEASNAEKPAKNSAAHLSNSLDILV